MRPTKRGAYVEVSSVYSVAAMGDLHADSSRLGLVGSLRPKAQLDFGEEGRHAQTPS